MSASADGALTAACAAHTRPAGPKEEIRPGDDVAARIQAKDGTTQWILAKAREVRANGKYDVRNPRKSRTRLIFI